MNASGDIPGQDPTPRAPGAVILLSHGSTDPRAAESLELLRGSVERRMAGPSVLLAALDHVRPTLAEAVDIAWRHRAGRAVVVPLLLSSAYHARVDVPQAVSAARLARPGITLALSSPLGPDPMLLDGADRLLADMGIRPSSGCRVVLAAAGSSHDDARALVGRLARVWRGHGWARTAHAFASGPGPTVQQAVAALRDGGGADIAVVPFVLAPGTLADRIIAVAEAEGAVATSASLGLTSSVTEVILARVRAVRSFASQ